MLEMIMFGVTLTVALVVSSLVVFGITLKLMTNKKIMVKFLKKYMEIVTEMTEELM